MTRAPQKIDYTIGVALAGHDVNEAAKVLLRRLRGAIDAGDLTLSGSEDMANAVRDGLVALERVVNTFDHFAGGKATKSALPARPSNDGLKNTPLPSNEADR